MLFRGCSEGLVMHVSNDTVKVIDHEQGGRVNFSDTALAGACAVALS
jgi:hypothetical protein